MSRGQVALRTMRENLRLPSRPRCAAPDHRASFLGERLPNEVRVLYARPDAARVRREMESTITASTSTTPVIMKATEESRLSNVRPDEMDWMTTMPSTAAKADPRPPNRLAPPI